MAGGAIGSLARHSGPSSLFCSNASHLAKHRPLRSPRPPPLSYRCWSAFLCCVRRCVRCCVRAASVPCHPSTQGTRGVDHHHHHHHHHTIQCNSPSAVCPSPAICVISPSIARRTSTRAAVACTAQCRRRHVSPHWSTASTVRDHATTQPQHPRLPHPSPLLGLPSTALK